MSQKFNYLACCDLFGIEQVVDTQIDEDLFVVRLEIFVVVDTCDRFFGTHLLSQNSRDDVALLLVIHSDKEVRFAHNCLAQSGKRGTIALYGEQIGHSRNITQEFAITLDNRYFVVVAAEHTCQMATDITGTSNNNLHSE